MNKKDTYKEHMELLVFFHPQPPFIITNYSHFINKETEAQEND